jgi:hypothetical protein
MTSATATMARMMATNARAFHAGPRSTPEYACPLRGVDPVLPGPRRVMRRSYSARLASSVVWGADAAVLFAHDQDDHDAANDGAAAQCSSTGWPGVARAFVRRGDAGAVSTNVAGKLYSVAHNPHE